MRVFSIPMTTRFRGITVREGVSLARALSSHPYFPPLLIHMIRAGEVTGNLPDMLERAADSQQQDLERRALTMAGLLEPVLILGIAIIIGFVAVSMLMAVFNLTSGLGA